MCQAADQCVRQSISVSGSRSVCQAADQCAQWVVRLYFCPFSVPDGLSDCVFVFPVCQAADQCAQCWYTDNDDFPSSFGFPTTTLDMTEPGISEIKKSTQSTACKDAGGTDANGDSFVKNCGSSNSRRCYVSTVHWTC